MANAGQMPGTQPTGGQQKLGGVAPGYATDNSPNSVYQSSTIGGPAGYQNIYDAQGNVLPEFAHMTSSDPNASMNDMLGDLNAQSINSSATPQQQAGAPQQQQPPGAPNVYQQASGAYGSALNTTGAATNMAAMMPTATGQVTPGQVTQGQTTQAQAQGYNPFTGLNASGNAMAGYGAGSASGSGYDAQSMNAARDVTAGQFAGTNMDPYMNPYTDNVIDRTQADMERARLIQQNQADDAMQAAGAFGGSRHGVANAETNRGYYDMMGNTMAGLRDQGYQNAQAAAFQDIGNTLQADTLNQQSDLTTNQYNAEAVNQARRTGANNSTQASIANAGYDTQLAGQRMGAMNDAARFGAQAFNDTSRFNAGSANDMSRFNAGSANDMSRFNAGSANDMSRFNAGAINAGEQNRFNNLMAGGSQMSGLASQGMNIGNSINDRQMQQGALTQQMQQQLIDSAKQQYGNYTNQGNMGLSPLAQFAGGNYGQTQTQTQDPGLLGTIGAGLGTAASLGWAPFCWVAREVYGPTNPEWLDFREWMLTKAPAWLRKGYMKHGPRIAAWVKRNQWSKRFLRPVMDWLKG